MAGIGHSMAKKLRTMNVLSVTDLLSCPSQILEKEFGNLQALLMTKLCRGIDDSKVTPSGEYKSISDEDSFKKCSTLEDARKRLVNLIDGLLPRVSSDVGKPETVRVTVRRQEDNSYKRESRQSRLPHTISFSDKDKARDSLLTACLQLFNKVVDVKKPFHLTLLGVSLSNFRKTSTVQSKNISKFFQMSFSKHKDASNLPTNDDSFGENKSTVSVSVNDKAKSSKSLENINQGTAFTGDEVVDSEDQKPEGCLEVNTQGSQEKETTMMELNEPIVCPKGIDPAVFSELPSEVQKELQAYWQQDTRTVVPNNSGKTDKSTPKTKRCSGIQKYFSKNQTNQASRNFK